MFSFLTADTKEQIRAPIHSKGASKDVYLVQPEEWGGNLYENEYLGYGRVGGEDVFEWLANANLGVGDRDLGIYINGTFETDENCIYLYEDEYFVEMDVFLPKNKKLILLQNDEDVPSHCTEERFNLPYPLKLSFDVNAKYEEIGISTVCPRQGG